MKSIVEAALKNKTVLNAIKEDKESSIDDIIDEIWDDFETQTQRELREQGDESKDYIQGW